MQQFGEWNRMESNGIEWKGCNEPEGKELDRHDNVGVTILFVCVSYLRQGSIHRRCRSSCCIYMLTGGHNNTILPSSIASDKSQSALAYAAQSPRPPSFHQVNSVENLPTEMKTGSDGACAALVCLYLPCLLIFAMFACRGRNDGRIGSCPSDLTFRLRRGENQPSIPTKYQLMFASLRIDLLHSAPLWLNTTHLTGIRSE